MPRCVNWDEGLQKDLRNSEFAREFILAAIEEGLSIQEALSQTIRAYGVKEFAKKIGMPSSNIVRAINPDHNPTQDTLNKLLKPFKLQLSVASTDKIKYKKAS